MFGLVTGLISGVVGVVDDVANSIDETLFGVDVDSRLMKKVAVYYGDLLAAGVDKETAKELTIIKFS